MKTRPYNSRYTGETGLTLVELIVAVALGSIVSLALIASFTSFSRTQTSQENITHLQQNLRAAHYFMAREFRMAGYKGANPTTSEARILNANPSYISFTLLADDDGINNDGDTETDESGELSQIVYEHYDSDGNGLNDAIGRTVDGGAREPVAENIEELEFYYTITSGSTSTKSTAPSALLEITAVDISILARTVRKDPNFTRSQTFTTPSGTTWGPYSDGRRRRLSEAYIRFRNL